ncbi:hypothetical protein MMC26_002374 [Xylographa opegraphella]|nr:hypothetical protein [Xylographa opegraphella]
MPKDFDLDLPSLWFINSPSTSPVSSMKANNSIAHTFPPPGTQLIRYLQNVLVASVRWPDLSTTKVQTTWRDTDPSHSLPAQQKHFPPRTTLSPDEVDRAHRNIAAWLESSLGQRFGDGGFWTLAQQALLNLAKMYRAHGHEHPLVS